MVFVKSATLALRVRMVSGHRSGQGFGSTNSRWVHFGLGDYRGEVFARVHWPIGGRSESRALARGRINRLVEPGSTAASREAAESGGRPPAAGEPAAPTPPPRPPAVRPDGPSRPPGEMPEPRERRRGRW